MPHFQVPAFTSAVVLLVNIWGVKRSGMTIDSGKEMDDVRACIRVLEDSEARWQVAGRLKSVFFSLLSSSFFLLPDSYHACRCMLITNQISVIQGYPVRIG